MGFRRIGIGGIGMSAAYLSGGVFGVPWYAGFLAAYQPIGAASLAASYVNLASPGVYDLTLGVAPAWDAVNGWGFDGLSTWLDTGIIPQARTWTYFVRFTGAVATDRVLLGSYEGGAARAVVIYANVTGGFRRYFNGDSNWLNVFPNVASGVLAISGTSAYYNGAPDGVIPGLDAPLSSTPLNIGRLSALGQYFDGSVQAVGIINTTKTAAQMAAISAAMALLP